MARFLMKLAYDGNRFHGWQTQPHKRTVQRSLRYALTRFAHKKIDVTGSGRTDTGVHAKGQYAHFDYEGNARGEQIRKGLRKYLPDDINVLSIIPVNPDFHARYDAFQRHYEYLIAKEETPFNRQYMGWFPRKQLLLEALQASARYFIGEYDFSSFSKPNPAVPDHVCQVTESFVTEYDDHYVYTVKATRFLHNMVRRMVGAMVNITPWIEP
jgi:tRNA pseudouridine38-40 synthase